ncbi:MAG: ABC transporter ATP-binding protein [Myxococcales bacterium]|nr:ABC transporter ATP-binding protein [Myxococcales bacterium]
MTAAIEISHATKRFGAKVAVNDVSFTIQEGACYGLIGPNGAGKTTTFSMLCGFLHPTAGTLRVLGVDPSRPGALKGKLGVLPQDALLPPAWPVGAFLSYLARLSGLGDPAREAKAALELVGLPETWPTPAGALSHGMAKRVAMAQAFMGDPPVVLLDEPTAGLDPKIAASVRQLIRQMKGKRTVVVSSHNLQELEELCDATAVLDRGNLVAAASMAEMTSQAAEFRVQIARGNVPLAELRALEGCTDAKLDPSGSLLVHFDGARVPPEEMISRAVRLLLERDVLILGVSRGKKLEERVLQLT